MPLTNKDGAVIQKIIDSYRVFAQESISKLNHYYQLLEQDRIIREASFEEVRFPVSLVVKDENVKGFHIAKLYGMSEKFKMEDMNSAYEKLKTIRSQILLAMKSQHRIIHK